MTPRHSLVIGLILTASLLPLSCGTSVYREMSPVLADGAYDAEFPAQNSSPQLEEISQTVQRISAIAYYRRYTFPASAGLHRTTIDETTVAARKSNVTYFNNTYSGTSTVIACEQKHIALLTCAHVVYFPDTIWTYKIDANRHVTDIVTALSVKERQSIFVTNIPEGGEVDVLAIDQAADLALLGKTCETAVPPTLPVFRYPLGKADELQWGTFLYLFGFPSGYKMVTKGIVSSPHKDKRNSFLIDAVFNRGFSGGLALALRDGVPHFELVGIVKMVSGRTTYTLVPSRPDDSVEFDLTVPYAGDVYIEKKTEIEYGVTQAISAEQVRAFLTSHQEELSQRGYSLRAFLGPD